MRAAARRRGRCAAPRCRYNRLSLAKVGCGAMEGAKSLDQGPGSEEVWAPADVWAQAGPAREALEALPVAVPLAVRRDGAVEPDLVYGNRASARLTSRAMSVDAGGPLSGFAQKK